MKMCDVVMMNRDVIVGMVGTRVCEVNENLTDSCRQTRVDHSEMKDVAEVVVDLRHLLEKLINIHKGEVIHIH